MYDSFSSTQKEVEIFYTACLTIPGPNPLKAMEGMCILRRPKIVIESCGTASFSLRCHAHRPMAKRLMDKANKMGNTSGASKSTTDWLNAAGFSGDVCVVFFSSLPGNP